MRSATALAPPSAAAAAASNTSRMQRGSTPGSCRVPSTLYVLPLPVCPYASTQHELPPSARRTRGATQRAYTSALLAVGGSTPSNTCARVAPAAAASSWSTSSVSWRGRQATPQALGGASSRPSAGAQRASSSDSARVRGRART